MKTELLRELFATMGDIEHVKLCKNRESRASLGFGFVKVILKSILSILSYIRIQNYIRNASDQKYKLSKVMYIIKV